MQVCVDFYFYVAMSHFPLLFVLKLDNCDLTIPSSLEQKPGNVSDNITMFSCNGGTIDVLLYDTSSKLTDRMTC